MSADGRGCGDGWRGAIGGSDRRGVSSSGHRIAARPGRRYRSRPRARGIGAHGRRSGCSNRYGRCDVLVHAAAAFDRAELATVDLATWRQVQAVNVESALLLAQAFAPAMAARGFGRIVFVVSDTVWGPPAGDMLPYVTSKGALVALARTLALGLGPDGIAVTCVAPGLTATPAARGGNARRRRSTTCLAAGVRTHARP